MKRILFVLMAAATLFSACKKNNTDPNNPINGGGSGGTTTIPNGKDVPAGANDGVTVLNNGTSVILNLYAPGKTSVSVIGEFNNWTPTTMNESTDGTRWWVQIDNINPTNEYAYQYVINGSLKVADPYTQEVLDPTNDPGIPASVYPNLKPYPTGKTTGIVSTFTANPTAYAWKVTNFTKPKPQNLVIYELHVRDFVATHSYQTLTDTLSYLVNLGVNAIELLPVNEFEGNDSWGYNPNFMFALDKYYGTKNMYKAFIDACHAKGIAVIQDIVLEDQFDSSPMVQMYANSSGTPTSDNPWFDLKPTHPDAVGEQLNHQRPIVQKYAQDVMKYWITEYHIDGFRFDQAKGYTENVTTDEGTWANYDASRVALWTKYNTYMKTLDPNFYVILEYFSANNEESVLANQGMMTWTNLSTPADQATMGFATNPSWDLSGLFYDVYGFTNPYALVAYWESHDEERSMFKNEQYGNSNGSYNVRDIPTALKREEMAAAFLMSSPGPKMMWQFEELGYDISINQNGRLGDKPILWNYKSDANRAHLYSTYAKYIRMKQKNAVFASTSFRYQLSTPVKTVTLMDASNNVVMAGNFDVVSQSTVLTFPSTGTWYDTVTGTSINITSVNYNITYAPGEYHIYSSSTLTF